MDRTLRPPVRRAHAWAAVLVWMGVIFGLSSIPGSSLPGSGGTLGHFVVYAVLGALLLAALLHEEASPGRAFAYAVLLASAYGVTDEFHQAFVPGRVPDAFDWGVDTLGALTGAAAALGGLLLVRSVRNGAE